MSSISSGGRLIDRIWFCLFAMTAAFVGASCAQLSVAGGDLESRLALLSETGLQRPAKFSGYMLTRGEDLGYAEGANAFGFLITADRSPYTEYVHEIGVYYPDLNQVRTIPNPCARPEFSKANFGDLVVYGSLDSRLWVHCRTLFDHNRQYAERNNYPLIVELDVSDPENISQQDYRFRFPGQSLRVGGGLITKHGVVILNSLFLKDESEGDETREVAMYAGRLDPQSGASVTDLQQVEADCSNAVNAPGPTCRLGAKVVVGGGEADYLATIIGLGRQPPVPEYFHAVRVDPTGRHRIVGTLPPPQPSAGGLQASARDWVVQSGYFEEKCRQIGRADETYCFAHRLWSPSTGKQVTILRDSADAYSAYTIMQAEFDRAGEVMVALLMDADRKPRKLAVFDVAGLPDGAITDLDSAPQTISLPGNTRSIGVTRDGKVFAFSRNRILHVGSIN